MLFLIIFPNESREDFCCGFPFFIIKKETVPAQYLTISHKEDFQAVDITSIVKPVTKWATTVLEPGQVPYAFQKAFYEMRSGRPGPVLIDLPFDVQMAEIEFDIDAYQPLPLAKPTATRVQVEKALALLDQAERPLLVAGGGIINADASDLLVEFAELTGIPVIPTLMGWGTIPDDHPLMVGMVGLQTSHRYGNATMLKSDVVLGIGNRWANRHTGSVDVYTEGRKFIHVDIEGTQIGRVFTPDLGIVSDAGAALDVFDDEPRVPAELLAMENVVLAPHMASGTHDTPRVIPPGGVVIVAASLPTTLPRGGQEVLATTEAGGRGVVRRPPFGDAIVTGASPDACAKSAERTAYPSIALLANGEMSMSATASSAKGRPVACHTGISTRSVGATCDRTIDCASSSGMSFSAICTS